MLCSHKDEMEGDQIFKHKEEQSIFYLKFSLSKLL